MAYKHEPHAFTRKVGGFTVCTHCGLVLLNNALTDWCVKRGCASHEHPDWPRVRVELVRKTP